MQISKILKKKKSWNFLIIKIFLVISGTKILHQVESAHKLQFVMIKK